MKYIKVKFLKNNEAHGRSYIYRAQDEIMPGDIVQIPSGSKGIVTDESVDDEWIENYGSEKIKEVIGKVIVGQADV